eukprot:1138260-Pelagomonas_calceolata.AAC.1
MKIDHQPGTLAARFDGCCQPSRKSIIPGKCLVYMGFWPSARCFDCSACWSLSATQKNVHDLRENNTSGLSLAQESDERPRGGYMSMCPERKEKKKYYVGSEKKETLSEHVPKYAPFLHLECAHSQPLHLIGTILALKCSWRQTYHTLYGIVMITALIAGLDTHEAA